MNLAILDLLDSLIRTYWKYVIDEHINSLNITKKNQNENVLQFLRRINNDGKDLEISLITNSLLTNPGLQMEINTGRQIGNKMVSDWVSDLLSLFENEGYEINGYEIKAKKDHSIVKAGASARPPGMGYDKLREHELERNMSNDNNSKKDSHVDKPPIKNNNYKTTLKIVGIIAAVLGASTIVITIAITVNYEPNNTIITNSSDVIANKDGNVMSKSPGGNIVEQKIDATNSKDMTVNQYNDNSNKGIPDDTIFKIYRDTEPYSIEWTGCRNLSAHTNQDDEVIAWTKSFTPVLLDKGSKPADIPFKTVFTFDIFGYVESSMYPIELDSIKTEIHTVNPKSSSPIELDLTDALDRGKKQDAYMVEIKLVKEKSVLYLPNSDDNHGDFISEDRDMIMTHIAHTKEPVEWSEMNFGDYKCNKLFILK